MKKFFANIYKRVTVKILIKMLQVINARMQLQLFQAENHITLLLVPDLIQLQ